jgi:hypothetical protein
MSDVHHAVVDYIRSTTNPERNCPPWATVGNVTGELYPAVEPETVRNALRDLARDDNRQQTPVVVQFDDPRHDPPVERVILLEGRRLEGAAEVLAKHPDVARDVCGQLADQDVVPKGFIGKINTALGRVEA